MFIYPCYCISNLISIGFSLDELQPLSATISTLCSVCICAIATMAGAIIIIVLLIRTLVGTTVEYIMNSSEKSH